MGEIPMIAFDGKASNKYEQNTYGAIIRNHLSEDLQGLIEPGGKITENEKMLLKARKQLDKLTKSDNKKLAEDAGYLRTEIGVVLEKIWGVVTDIKVIIRAIDYLEKNPKDSKPWQKGPRLAARGDVNLNLYQGLMEFVSLFKISHQKSGRVETGSFPGKVETERAKKAYQQMIRNIKWK